MKISNTLLVFLCSLYSFKSFGWPVFGAMYQDPNTNRRILLMGDYHKEDDSEATFSSLFKPYLYRLLDPNNNLSILVESNDIYRELLVTVIRNGFPINKLSLLNILSILPKNDLIRFDLLNAFDIPKFSLSKINIIPADYRINSIYQAKGIFGKYILNAAKAVCEYFVEQYPEKTEFVQIDELHALPCLDALMFDKEGNVNIEVLERLKESFNQALLGIYGRIYKVSDLIIDLNEILLHLYHLRDSIPNVNSIERGYIAIYSSLIESLIALTKQLFKNEGQTLVDGFIEIGLKWKSMAELYDYKYFEKDLEEKNLYWQTFNSFIEDLGDVGFLIELLEQFKKGNSNIFIYAGSNHLKLMTQILGDMGYQEMVKFDKIAALQPLNNDELNQLFIAFNP